MTRDGETWVTVVRPQCPHAHLGIEWLVKNNICRPPQESPISFSYVSSWCWSFETPTSDLPDGFERVNSSSAYNPDSFKAVSQ